MRENVRCAAKVFEMTEECIICGAPLEYLETDVLMECEICHKKENSKTRCVNGHYVCNECHMEGLDDIIGFCMSEASKDQAGAEEPSAGVTDLGGPSKDPVYIIEKMMAMPFCHMHGPEHHVMVGAALLTAYKNAGGDIDLRESLLEMLRRGKTVPGGVCGFWGACGAAISTGIFISIISGSTPLSEEPFALSNQMTALSLGKIADIGGPRCCKRDSFLSIIAAVDYVKEHFGVEMEIGGAEADGRESANRGIICRYSSQNAQCIGKRCPFRK